ncbi:AcrR family transcriptional regulator [Spinactinospora alkalitolerans]|uniref:AcrR family transcriptional regulator n=1 Tax=Spinactinospora alkalitolerans TaxID=687207 RepID=A0A852U3C9_9ACTN|nr:TetR/AcrR family transcriptional regulator [Spinactinospora alkalitolerans]NYE50005.1 AcrR family transcriptional regulator [Spinactinospora alkalitolerans]
MSPETRRDRLRAQMSEDVRAAAREIITKQGIEALTLAEIARKVGVTPAALYRHFDDLADIVRYTARDIVSELTSELHAVVDAQPEDDIATRLIAPCRGFRRWSLDHRQEFSLLFGTPTSAAGKAHEDVTSDWVLQLAAVWGPIFLRLWSTRPYEILDDDELDPLLRQQMADYRKSTGVDMPLGALVVFLSCWRSIYGAVALEVFDHFTPLIADQEPMFELLMWELLTRLGLGDEYRPPRSDGAHPKG